MSGPTHDPDLSAVERTLAALAPSAGTFDRDALMFAAGRRSVRRGWAWPATAAGSAVAAAVLAAVLIVRPAPAPEVRYVVREVERAPAPAPATPAAPVASVEEAPPTPARRDGDYLTLRQQVERWGDAALPGAPPSAEEAPTNANPFDLPPDVEADPWLRRARPIQPRRSAVNRPLVLLVLATCAAPAAAQPPPPAPIKLLLPPAAEPVPAQKYLLLPELTDKTPGNAVLLYYRAFSPEWWSNVRQRAVMEKVEKATETPIADLKNSDLRWLMDYKALREVDRGARREYCDWELARRLKEDGIYLLIPDIQAMREFALFLTVRARLEMAAGQLDKALYTLQTGFALARHVGDGPTYIQALVGIAVGSRMVVQVEELLRQPGAPNLYWALTDLPRPFIDLRTAIQGEKLWLLGTWPELRDVDNPYLSPRQRERLQAIAEQIVNEGYDWGRKPDAGTRLATVALVAKAYPGAKRALVAAGRKPEEVEALPALQVALAQALRDYERLRDDMFKWMALPYPEARPGLARAERALKEAKVRQAGIPIAETFLPAAMKVHTAAARIDRRIAALRCVEALRLHAAAHDGKLPAALADVKEVPVPIDPMTGKPFAYKVSGDTATLSAGPPPGDSSPQNTLIYELTLRK